MGQSAAHLAALGQGQAPRERQPISLAADRLREKESHMKKHYIAGSILLGLFLLAAAAPGQAQQPLRVKIPFGFVADKVSLPAGEYMIQPARFGSSVLIVQRIGSHRGEAAMVTTHAASANNWKSESCLVFRVYDNRYFLSEMWTAGTSTGRQLLTSPIEKELAKNETSHQLILLASLQAPKR
jgi:hypothetical protein